MIRLLKYGLVLSSVLFAVAGRAAGYPEKPISVVVPFAPGGPTDTSARVVAAALSKKLDVPFVVENVPGAGSIIGTTRVARAAPDGYMLLWGTASGLSIIPYLESDIKYDPNTSFAPISQVAAAPFILAAKPALKLETANDLVQLARSKPGSLNFASTGTGGSAHLIGELFKQTANISVEHVPYNGGAPMMTALLSGDVDFLFDTPTTIVPMVKDKRVVPLGVTSLQRWPELPDLKTLDEQGFKGFDATTWFGLLAPKGTPVDRINLLNQNVAAVLADPAVRKALKDAGFFVQPSTPQEFARKIADDGKKWSDAIKAAHIEMKR